MQLFKNKKGSQLVEKILMTAFAVAGGGAVIVYGSNVLTNAKNTEITGILGNSGGGVIATSSSGVQLIAGHKYKFSSIPSFDMSVNQSLQKTDMEYFSVSKFYNQNGTEKIWENYTGATCSYHGFIGYSCWYLNDETNEFYLEEPSYCYPYPAFSFSEQEISRMFGWYRNDNYPMINADWFDVNIDVSESFEFSGTYVRQGNGPCLLDYLVEVE